MNNQPVQYVRMGLNSKDFMIIRQHFCNDELIKHLWENRDNDEAISEVDRWLWKMVELSVKQPDRAFLRKLTGEPESYRDQIERRWKEYGIPDVPESDMNKINLELTDIPF